MRELVQLQIQGHLDVQWLDCCLLGFFGDLRLVLACHRRGHQVRQFILHVLQAAQAHGLVAHCFHELVLTVGETLDDRVTALDFNTHLKQVLLKDGVRDIMLC